MKNKLKFRLRSSIFREHVFSKYWDYRLRDWRVPSLIGVANCDMTKLMNIFGCYNWKSLDGTKIAWSIFKNQLSEGTFVIQIDPNKDFSCNICVF